MKRRVSQDFGWLLALVLVIAAGLSVARFWGADPAGPASPSAPEFAVYVEYFPGYVRDPLWWRVTVRADGHATRWSDPETDAPRAFTVDPEKLKALRRTVLDEKFFSLKKQYEYPATDMSTITLKIQLDGRENTVEVYGAGHLKKNPEVQRFLRVLDAVVDCAPPPERR